MNFPARHSTPLHRKLQRALHTQLHSFQHVSFKRRLWDLVTLRNVATIAWLSLIYWAERTVFRDSLNECQWDKWETWPSDAAPYRMVLIADPQLVDPHTYDRRGISLKATMFYSDMYMRKSYSLLNSILAPQTIAFLGDLFDGGREWATEHGDSGHVVDPHALSDWKDYGENYWENEFIRFSTIFPHVPGVKNIRSLPGNHDLGIGNGVQENVAKRFKAFFGETSSVHTLGNHTFVLIDSVSLENTENRNIYEPARNFLDEFTQVEKSTADILHPEIIPQSRRIQSSSDPQPAAPASSEPQPLPRVLLTHVPLYRPPSTPCGPLRESGNSIGIFGGFQYQNVLTADTSGDVIKKVQPVFVASGDDHDYCEVLHAGATGMVKEITVKSFSFTMGVRHPGFLLVSLWNPLSGTKPLDSGTIQTKLCLLPDQLGLFKTYFLAFGLMKFLLTLSMVYFWLRKKKEDPLLPVVQEDANRAHNQKPSEYGMSSVSSWSGSNGNGINTRAAGGKAQQPTYGGYGIPSVSPAPYNDTEDDKYSKKGTSHLSAAMVGLPNLQQNINTHLTQLGNAAEKVGSLMADKVVERVPSLGPVVEGGREIVRREIKKKGFVRKVCGRLGGVLREWAPSLAIVGIWYIYLISNDV
ncbi:hypothetical protein DFH27DRAFT_556899 [Peziza echinospora]|nr:hypothetical protein DFH27DRAFT_556899 [Peziza echinospora]